MSIPLKIRERAFEGLLHGQPKKALARELGISTGAIRDWSIFIQYGFFDWVTKPYVIRGQPKLLRRSFPNGACASMPQL